MASWQDPALDPQFIAWARDTATALGPWAVSGGYVNYMQGDEPIERVRAAFGDETFERLRTLKRRYDPNNVLRRNQNIPPGPGLSRRLADRSGFPIWLLSVAVAPTRSRAGARWRREAGARRSS